MMTNQAVAYLLGAYWYDNNPRDQTARFVQAGIWENGYETEYLDLVKSISVGSPVFIKSLFYHNGLKTSVLRIKASGIVTDNPSDGQLLKVNWDKSFEEEDLTERDIPGVGRYWDTVERVTEFSHLTALFHEPQPSEEPKRNFPLNQILYGPPGTGKTYHTAVRAIGLLEGLTDAQVHAAYPDRQALRLRYEEFQQAGRIQFVTFHQAFSYEDFVEGIKPVPPARTNPDELDEPAATDAPNGLQYDIEAGVFKRLCETAAAAATPEQLPTAIPFDELYNGFVAQLKQQLATTDGPLTFPTKEGRPVMLVGVDKDLPGRLSFLHNTSNGLVHNQDKSWIKRIYDKYSSVDQITRLKRDLSEAIGGANASLQYVVFRELKKYEAQYLTEERRKLQKRPAPRFVLIIDEINRGNVANIFGELITLLEDDKRAGRPEALTVKLPYSKEDFMVPENLYLLGTMNTADRSVEALDTALRRRFSFTEMRPEADVIRRQVGENGVVAGIDVARLLEVLNSRLEQLLDRDHCLGHALLLRLETIEDLRAAFQRNILPLLQEYFFGDWGKIGLVLGAKFVEVIKANAPGRFALAGFAGYEAAGLRDKPLYRLTAPESWDAAAFQSIYPATT